MQLLEFNGYGNGVQWWDELFLKRKRDVNVRAYLFSV